MRSSFAFIPAFMSTLAVSALLAPGCVHKVTIQSAPADAVVYQLDDKGARTKKIGTTPLVLDHNALQNRDQAVEIVKDGFLPAVVLVEKKYNRDERYQVTLPKLDSDWFFQNLHHGEHAGILNTSISEILPLQAAILQGRLEEARAMSDNLLSKFDKIASFHILRGHIFRLSKNKAEALNSYRRALSLEPANAEAAKSLELIK